MKEEFTTGSAELLLMLLSGSPGVKHSGWAQAGGVFSFAVASCNALAEVLLVSMLFLFNIRL